jgi:hypothetical protein
LSSSKVDDTSKYEGGSTIGKGILLNSFGIESSGYCIGEVRVWLAKRIIAQHQSRDARWKMECGQPLANKNWYHITSVIWILEVF